MIGESQRFIDARERLVNAVEACRIGKTGAYAELEAAHREYELVQLEETGTIRD
jgi:hypothetical protein